MKLSGYVLTAIAAVSLAACGNLSDVSKEGTTDEVVWPKIESARFNHDGSQLGSWPNWDNVNMIEKGMNKDQLYNLIGRPHFAEGLFAVREWDYVFNYREKGELKVCQFKVLFDSDMNAQSFFWLPEGCNVRHGDNIELSGDFLFNFDKATLTPQGKRLVGDVAKALSNDNKPFTVSGYTDPLGSTAYNLQLSQRRADTVKAELVSLGIAETRITTVGKGEADQVKACPGLTGSALIECLGPNRRTVITFE